MSFYELVGGPYSGHVIDVDDDCAWFILPVLPGDCSSMVALGPKDVMEMPVGLVATYYRYIKCDHLGRTYLGYKYECGS